MIRVLLVDDQSVVRRALRVRFHLEPDLEVVGEASTGSEALTLAQTLTPDVVLMDIQMPEMDGIAATAALLTRVSDDALYLKEHMLHHLEQDNASSEATRDKRAVSLAVWRQKEERELYGKENDRICGVPGRVPAGIGGQPQPAGSHNGTGSYDEIEGRV